MGCRYYAATWVITEKTDNLSKTESKLRLDFALWGTVSKNFPSAILVSYLREGHSEGNPFTGTQQQMALASGY